MHTGDSSCPELLADIFKGDAWEATLHPHILQQQISGRCLRGRQRECDRVATAMRDWKHAEF